jgi:hypothetical protein
MKALFALVMAVLTFSGLAGAQAWSHDPLRPSVPFTGYRDAVVCHVRRQHGKDSTLRRWGLSLGARGGSHARRRAVVAVAWKLAVLLHRIWITQEAYVAHCATLLTRGPVRKRTIEHAKTTRTVN